jgi:hypothetical protein
MALQQGEHADALLGDLGGEAEGTAHLGQGRRDFFTVIDDEGEAVSGSCHWFRRPCVSKRATPIMNPAEGYRQPEKCKESRVDGATIGPLATAAGGG